MAYERRRTPRCPLVAYAEVVELQSNTHLRARTSDLSLDGCYLETTNAFPAGTEIRVKIAHNAATFTALGVVVYSESNVGMGIGFIEVQLDQHTILERWLVELVY